MPVCLSADLDKRLETIRGHVRNLWEHHTEPPWYTFHNASHSHKVEEMLYRIIPADKCDQLSEEEWFYLLASTWLHDVGMILNLFGRDEDFKRVRDTHHERSVEYIKQNRAALGLDPWEASIVAEICKYHRKKYDITTCDEKVGNIRLRLLAAYLRLADALHIDSTRTTGARYELLLAAGMPMESRFHWLKSRWVRSIIPELDNLRICVSVFDTAEDSPRRGLLPRLVEDELREELDSVRDVLIRGKISYFFDIETEIVRLPLDEDVLIELELVLSNIELVNLSSASEVANNVISTVIRLAELGPDAYAVIRDYRHQLEEVLKARPCHTLFQTVLEKVARATQEEELPDEARRTRVEQIKADLESYQETRDRNLSALAENARPFLLDGGSILLFGYSSMVLEALKRLPSKVKESTYIYIAEGRGKTQYSYANEIVYSDGLNYAIHVKEAKFDHVAIVPDICIGNLMARELIHKVVFGANGIDPTGRFGHTAGHLAIADLAHLYNVPVYVIADTAKFGELRWRRDLERDIQWLTRDPKSLKLLDKYGIRTLNPREDIVEPNKVDMLITEVGAFPPTRIPESIKHRISLG